MMTPNAMASFIISQIQNINEPNAAISMFYSALCSYVSLNMQVQYSWSATTPPPVSTPDPMVLLDCKVLTSGSMTPSGATTPDSACSMFSAALNQNAATWQVIWPAGFTLSPAFIIPTINITPSGATDMNSAWLAVCSQIIAGLKAATPMATGVHGSFSVPTPGAIFTQIL
jgi:hypothetical protein